MHKRSWWFLVALVSMAIGAASCGGGTETGRLVEVDLSAEVVDWEVVDGEVVEVWGYNGQYPGPLIEAEVGDTIRVNLTNNLAEGTTIHWHGIAVPNEEDGVPGITQPIVEPGQTWTYEFKAELAATTMYHTHANTVRQMARGLLGPLVIRERSPLRSPKYDSEYTLVLHEIDGLFTINGHSFPATLADDRSLIAMKTGDLVRVRMINAGQQHHPMHMHGHQFKVIALDGSDLETPFFMNTVDVAPGQTVDVEVIGDNPGTWTFHCHVLPHVTNRGVYPGGMLTLVDYTDHTSFLEGGPASQQPQAAAPATTVPDEAAPPDTDATIIEISATEFAFGPADLLVQPGETVTVRLRNDGAQIHNIEMPDLRVFLEAVPGVTEEVTFTVPADTGTISFWCNIAGHRESGMEGTVIIS